MKPTTKAVLQWLQSGKELTIQTGIRYLGQSAITQRVSELRASGYDIKDKFAKTAGERKPYKVYWMETVAKPAPKTETIVRAHTRRINQMEQETPESQIGLFQ